MQDTIRIFGRDLAVGRTLSLEDMYAIKKLARRTIEQRQEMERLIGGWEKEREIARSCPTLNRWKQKYEKEKAERTRIFQDVRQLRKTISAATGEYLRNIKDIEISKQRLEQHPVKNYSSDQGLTESEETFHAYNEYFRTGTELVRLRKHVTAIEDSVQTHVSEYSEIGKIEETVTGLVNTFVQWSLATSKNTADISFDEPLVQMMGTIVEESSSSVDESEIVTKLESDGTTTLSAAEHDLITTHTYTAVPLEEPGGCEESLNNEDGEESLNNEDGERSLNNEDGNGGVSDDELFEYSSSSDASFVVEPGC